MLGERVGWPLEKTEPLKLAQAVIASLERTDINLQSLYSFVAGRVHSSGLAALCFLYIDDLLNARIWASKTLNFAHEHFFGEWQNKVPTGTRWELPPNPSWWRNKNSWSDEFSLSMLWGSALGCWSELQSLSEYVHDEIRLDLGQSESKRAWLRIVAGVHCGFMLNDLKKFNAIIENGRPKREQLLLSFLNAVLEGNDVEVAQTSGVYFKWYKANEWPKSDSMLNKITVDGTWLVHFARHLGRTVPLPRFIIDHIVTLDETKT